MFPLFPHLFAMMLKKLKFCEDLQDLLELTPKKDVLFIIGDWNAKVGTQEIPGVTDKLGHGVQNQAEQRLTEFCQENTLVIANSKHQSCLMILEIIMNFQIFPCFIIIIYQYPQAWN